MKQLHIYGQTWEHSNVTILGNREALEYLGTLINEALSELTQEDKTEIFFAADGEGYKITVFETEDISKWPLSYKK